MYKHNVVDGFYKNPSAFLYLAQSTQYPINSSNYPGVRSKNLYHLDVDMFRTFCEHVLSLYFKYTVSCNVMTMFQCIERFSDDPDSALNTGWIHLDTPYPDSQIAGIVYLNEIPEKNTGTNLYKLKSMQHPSADLSKFALYGGNSVNIKHYTKQIQKANSNYELTLSVENKYNRMLCYDGSHPHGVPSYYRQHGSRLTQVFFIKDIMPGQFQNCHTPSPDGVWAPYTLETNKQNHAHS
jgi:hypothetical protein